MSGSSKENYTLRGHLITIESPGGMKKFYGKKVRRDFSRTKQNADFRIDFQKDRLKPESEDIKTGFVLSILSWVSMEPVRGRFDAFLDIHPPSE